MASYETRAGLRPSERKLPFTISTSDAEAYLQKCMDVLCSKSKGLPKSITVRLYTTEVSSKFLPLVVVLPVEVLATQKKGKDDTHVDPIFNISENTKTEHLIPAIYKFFSAFTYNNGDTRAFVESSDWRRQMQVSRQTAMILKKTSKPRIDQFRADNGRKIDVVTFLIDPIRLFHNMLKMDSDTRDFRVNINSQQKIRAGEFNYFVTREVPKSKNRKYENNMAIELNRKMRGK